MIDNESDRPPEIAVLMTCFNRRDKTLRCLRTLFDQDAEARVHVFLVDDASSDGTAEAVSREFPQVDLIPGTGDLYWAGGTRLARETAIGSQADFLLWLNDDCELERRALSILIETFQKVIQTDGRVIVVGALRDPRTGKTTYTGQIRDSRWRPMHFLPVEPTSDPQPCDAMNGNVVMYPRAVDELVGNIDAAFVHTMGDLDFGLRAKSMGCQIWLAPGYVGSCEKNVAGGSYTDPGRPVFERFRKIRDIKAMYPPSRIVFLRRHAGRAWPVFWISPLVNIVLTSFRHRFFRRQEGVRGR